MAFISSPSAGTPGVWEFAGPSGGHVSELCRDTDGVLYAGIGSQKNGIYRSLDDGANWEYCGLPNREITALAADAVLPGWVYAGTKVGVEYRTTDGGNTWGSLPSQLPDNCFMLATDPELSLVVFASTGNTIYRSSDGGSSWSTVFAAYANALCFAPSNPNIVYSGGQFMMKSTDRGLSWTGISGGVSGWVWGIAVSYDDPDLAYGSLADIGSRSIIRTVDGGATAWATISSARGGGKITTHPDDGNIICTFDYESGRSTDGGNTWSSFPSGWPSIGDLTATDVLISGTSHDHLTVSLGGEGVVRSTDGGDTWEQRSRGIDAVGVTRACITDHTPGHLHVVTGIDSGGYYRSLDGGESWILAHPFSSSAESETYYGLAVSPFNQELLFLAAYGLGSRRSTDGGTTWQVTEAGADTHPSCSFAFGSGGAVYSGLKSNDPFRFSPNDGVDWYEQAAAGLPSGGSGRLPFALAVDPLDPDVVYLSGVEELDMSVGYGVFKTTDAGENWTVIHNGLNEAGSRTVSSLVLDPTNSQTIYAATDVGVYRSVNGAALWVKTSEDLDEVTALAISPFSSDQLLAAGRSTVDGERAIFFSNDKGATWSTLGTNLPHRTDITCDRALWSYPWVAFDPVVPGKAWAAVANSGLWAMEGLPLFTADLNCAPHSGALPFSTRMTVTLENLYTLQVRRLAAQINVRLAGGTQYPNWRFGFTDIGAGLSYTNSWHQSIPAFGSLVGDNLFELEAIDVTPAPYNQPPYPTSGGMRSDSCTVTGIAP